jgi:hypothetical protein
MISLNCVPSLVSVLLDTPDIIYLHYNCCYNYNDNENKGKFNFLDIDYKLGKNE